MGPHLLNVVDLVPVAEASKNDKVQALKKLRALQEENFGFDFGGDFTTSSNTENSPQLNSLSRPNHLVQGEFSNLIVSPLGPNFSLLSSSPFHYADLENQLSQAPDLPSPRSTDKPTSQQGVPQHHHGYPTSTSPPPLTISLSVHPSQFQQPEESSFRWSDPCQLASLHPTELSNNYLKLSNSGSAVSPSSTLAFPNSPLEPPVVAATMAASAANTGDSSHVLGFASSHGDSLNQYGDASQARANQVLADDGCQQGEVDFVDWTRWKGVGEVESAAAAASQPPPKNRTTGEPIVTHDWLFSLKDQRTLQCSGPAESRKTEADDAKPEETLVAKLSKQPSSVRRRSGEKEPSVRGDEKRQRTKEPQGSSGSGQSGGRTSTGQPAVPRKLPLLAPKPLEARAEDPNASAVNDPQKGQLRIVGGQVYPRTGLVFWKHRLRWTMDLQEKFTRAVEALGGPEVATPKMVLKTMGVSGLNLWHVKSYLQKVRLAKSGKKADGTKKGVVKKAKGSKEEVKQEPQEKTSGCGSGGASGKGGQQQQQQQREEKGEKGGRGKKAVKEEGKEHGNLRKELGSAEARRIAEALQQQMAMMDQVQHQLQHQCHLQLQIEAQGKRLQKLISKRDQQAPLATSAHHAATSAHQGATSAHHSPAREMPALNSITNRPPPKAPFNFFSDATLSGDPRAAAVHVSTMMNSDWTSIPAEPHGAGPALLRAGSGHNSFIRGPTPPPILVDEMGGGIYAAQKTRAVAPMLGSGSSVLQTMISMPSPHPSPAIGDERQPTVHTPNSFLDLGVGRAGVDGVGQAQNKTNLTLHSYIQKVPSRVGSPVESVEGRGGGRKADNGGRQEARTGGGMWLAGGGSPQVNQEVMAQNSVHQSSEFDNEKEGTLALVKQRQAALLQEMEALLLVRQKQTQELEAQTQMLQLLGKQIQSLGGGDGHTGLPAVQMLSSGPGTGALGGALRISQGGSPGPVEPALGGEGPGSGGSARGAASAAPPLTQFAQWNGVDDLVVQGGMGDLGDRGLNGFFSAASSGFGTGMELEQHPTYAAEVGKQMLQMSSRNGSTHQVLSQQNLMEELPQMGEGSGMWAGGFERDVLREEGMEGMVGERGRNGSEMENRQEVGMLLSGMMAGKVPGTTGEGSGCLGLRRFASMPPNLDLGGGRLQKLLGAAPPRQQRMEATHQQRMEATHQQQEACMYSTNLELKRSSSTPPFPSMTAGGGMTAGGFLEALLCGHDEGHARLAVGGGEGPEDEDGIEHALRGYHLEVGSNVCSSELDVLEGYCNMGMERGECEVLSMTGLMGMEGGVGSGGVQEESGGTQGGAGMLMVDDSSTGKLYDLLEDFSLGLGTSH